MSFDIDALARKHERLEGVFQAELAAGSWREFRTPKTSGVSFSLRITQPCEHLGRVVGVRWLLEGPEGIVSQDVATLKTWVRGVDAPTKADTPVRLFEGLWKASRKRALRFKFAARPGMNGTTEQVVTGVTVEPPTAAAAAPVSAPTTREQPDDIV